MAVALQAWVAAQEPLFELLLLVHTAFLLLTALLARVFYRWPPAPLLLPLTGIPAALFLLFVAGVLSLFEYTPLAARPARGGPLRECMARRDRRRGLGVGVYGTEFA